MGISKTYELWVENRNGNNNLDSLTFYLTVLNSWQIWFKSSGNYNSN